ncbi:MAG: hypothetical protein IJW18_00760 [Lachnospiraceae bacterium]|nr:hypothetical protein [Lachnospiraceae bacterium]
MNKALLKKQFMEVFAWVYRNPKTGKSRSKLGILGNILMYVVVFGIVGVMFFGVADSLCKPLASVGFAWLYMALMGLMAMLLGVIGSVFNTYTSLYQAKDNDLLLSLPIPASKILIIRLIGVYAMGLMYELMVMIPAIIVLFVNVSLSLPAIIFSILIPIVLSILILTLSCILGWLVALVSSKLKSKNIITVILSLAFIAAYYYFYGQAYSMLQAILANPQAIGDSIKSVLYPFYHMGLASEGNAVSMLIFSGIIFAIFAVVYFILMRSFIKLATTNLGSKKVKYKAKDVKMKSIKSALFRKEMRRFLGSSSYMLNCGLGIVFLIILTAIIVVKAGAITTNLPALLGDGIDILPLFIVAGICMMAGMNDISAPSVSLEGKTIWQLQSLPVKASDVITAKLNLHLVLTLVPSLISTVAMIVIFRPGVVMSILMVVVVALFVLFTAEIGLVLGLKMPNLSWSTEIVPIKQSMSVTIALFAGWIIMLVFGVIYFLIYKFITVMIFMIGVTAVLALLSFLFYKWLTTRGARIFEEL